MIFWEENIKENPLGPQKNKENNEYERRTNAESKELFKKIDIVGVLKSRRLSWAGHVWRAKDRLANEVTIWKQDQKNTNTMTETALDRGARGGIVEAAMGLNGPE